MEELLTLQSRRWPGSAASSARLLTRERGVGGGPGRQRVCEHNGGQIFTARATLCQSTEAIWKTNKSMCLICAASWIHFAASTIMILLLLPAI